jgi:probable HAF family extracellular repeat protein
MNKETKYMKKLLKLLIALVVVANIHISAQTLSFRSIDVPGATATQARGINPQGDVVGYYNVGANTYGFLLIRGMLKTIEDPNGIGSTQAWGISANGDIVGFYGSSSTNDDATQTHAFLRHPDGTFVALDYPDELLPASYPLPVHTMAVKITSTGRIVGCFHHHFDDFVTTMHGWVSQDGNFEPPFPLLASMHNGITPDGNTIVGVVFQTMTQSHAYVVSNGATRIIDPAGSISAGAWDINPAGEIVGYFTDVANHTHGFLLANGAYTVIDFPGDGVVATQIRGVNAEGDIVGQYTDGRGVHGFLAIQQ